MSDNISNNSVPDKQERPELKRGRRGKRKADVVRPGPLYKIIDAIVTIAGLALIGSVIMYIIMIFG